jgi:cellobiose epimerase
MVNNDTHRMRQVVSEMSIHLETQLIPFWLSHGIDHEYGGFITSLNPDGSPTGDMDKMLVSQCRLLWAMSSYALRYPNRPEFLERAKSGMAFLKAHFWDERHEGWFWKVSRAGERIDYAKILYGQCFAILALCAYHRAAGDEDALRLAHRSFELIQIYASDSLNGGYFEYFRRDWSLCEAGLDGGDRKTIDCHNHLLEALNALVQEEPREICVRKLEELVHLMISKMINGEESCVGNHFDPSYRPIPPVFIRHTWNAEREIGRVARSPANSTPFGHNMVFTWLLNRSCQILGKPGEPYNALSEKLVNYTLEHGFDHERGGLYQDGTHDGIVLAYDKDFWQAAEALIGFLDAFEHIGSQAYLEAFYLTWDFIRRFMVNPDNGEWYQLVSKEGKPIITQFSIWRSGFHSCRAIMECIDRLEQILRAKEMQLSDG